MRRACGFAGLAFLVAVTGACSRDSISSAPAQPSAATEIARARSFIADGYVESALGVLDELERGPVGDVEAQKACELRLAALASLGRGDDLLAAGRRLADAGNGSLDVTLAGRIGATWLRAGGTLADLDPFLALADPARPDDLRRVDEALVQLADLHSSWPMRCLYCRRHGCVLACDEARKALESIQCAFGSPAADATSPNR